jgi:transcriptional regulator with XRE-family HTH domain
MAEKLFLGPKLRKLREARGWTLEACAERLGLSPSYLSQIETNQRPATARVLIALTRAFHIDASLFDLEGDARLIADLREATTDIAGPGKNPRGAAYVNAQDHGFAFEVPASARNPFAAASSSASGDRDRQARHSRSIRTSSPAGSPASRSDRAATCRAASTMSGALRAARDCCGTLVRLRSCVDASGLATSKIRRMPGTSWRSSRV